MSSRLRRSLRGSFWASRQLRGRRTRPAPALAIVVDAGGLVVLASPGDDLFRRVDRLACDGREARLLFNDSRAPTLDLEDVRAHYGPSIALLRLS